MHGGFRIGALIAPPEPHRRERIGKGMGRAFTGKNLCNANLICIKRWLALSEERFDFMSEIGRHNFIRINVEQPIMLALRFTEALLAAIAFKCMRNHACAMSLGHRAGCVGRMRIDDNNIVRKIAHRFNRATDPIGFITRDDEDGERSRAFCHRPNLEAGPVMMQGQRLKHALMSGAARHG